MLGDNKTSLTFIKDSENQNYIKYIDVIHHHIHGLTKDEEISIESISIIDMFVNGLTNFLFARSFKRH